MARLEKLFTGATGRDAGKKFLITEMAPRRGHEWATRAILAMMSAGVEIPDSLSEGGMAGLAVMGLTALGRASPVVVMPLLDELLTCVQSVQPNGTRAWIDDDFEEISTIFMLQKEAFLLHTSPFTSGDLSTSDQTAAATGA